MNINDMNEEEMDPSRLKIKKTIRNFLKCGADFVLLGPTSSGKSTLILNIMKEMNTGYIKINCISSSNKAKILNNLQTELNDMFVKAKPRKITKFSVFLDFMQEEATIKSLNNIKIFVIFDNIEKLEASDSFFSHLFSLKNIINLQISFIFVGLFFKEDILNKNHDISLIPKIYLPIPSEEFLKNVLYDLHKNFCETEKKSDDFTKFLNKFVGDFSIITRNIEVLLNLAPILWFYKTASKSVYEEAKKLLMENPKIDSRDLKRKLQDLQNQSITNQQSQSNIYTPIFLKKLKLIPTVILIACYFGNENPEKTDKFMFKSYRNKFNKKTVSSFQDKKIKKDGRKGVAFLRLVALSQSLISILGNSKNENNLADKNYYYDFKKEKQLYDQSLGFYNQINDLVEEGLMSRVNSKDLEPNKMKFLCNVERNAITGLCQKIEMKFGDFYYSGDKNLEN